MDSSSSSSYNTFLTDIRCQENPCFTREIDTYFYNLNVRIQFLDKSGNPLCPSYLKVTYGKIASDDMNKFVTKQVDMVNIDAPNPNPNRAKWGLFRSDRDQLFLYRRICVPGKIYWCFSEIDEDELLCQGIHFV